MVQKTKEYLNQNGVMATNKCMTAHTELDLLMVNILRQKNKKTQPGKLETKNSF